MRDNNIVMCLCGFKMICVLLIKCILTVKLKENPIFFISTKHRKKTETIIILRLIYYDLVFSFLFVTREYMIYSWAITSAGLWRNDSKHLGPIISTGVNYLLLTMLTLNLVT